VTRNLRVCLVARSEPGTTGTSRYTAALAPRLAASGCTLVPTITAPRGKALALGRRLGMDVVSFLSSYPIRLSWPAADVYHLTGQTYAGILLSNPPPGPTVVTVHDIIPFLVRRDRRLNVYRHSVHRVFDWIAMRGLRRADALISDSEWTRETLIQELGIAGERITPVPLGVDTATYRPLDVPAAFRQRHSLSAGLPYVLYVGSEDPRKNLETLWRAFAQVAEHHATAQLLKVGRGHYPTERDRLRCLADSLGVANRVRFLDDVPEEDLPMLYNLASVYVQPSLFEGFGLPVLESLACGTRVVCARTSALPEVAGADTSVVPPTVDGLASSLLDALRTPQPPYARQARVSYAAARTWEETAERTIACYRGIRTQ
jgi:glycosyltransferase involved in cell wall biosynthesis